MPANQVSWSSVDTWQRLVAAIVATGVKIDLHEVAKHYGTTYDTIQNRYRKIRKEADALKAEVDGGERSEIATPRKTTKTSCAATPKSKTKSKDALSAVTNGRVIKPSPTKKTKAVKQEKAAEAEDDIFAGVDFGTDLGDVGMGGDDFLLN